MQDLSAYQIEVKGQLNGDGFNATSPTQITVKDVSDTRSIFNFLADQSGLIGIIRFLHRQGFIIISISRQQ